MERLGRKIALGGKKWNKKFVDTFLLSTDQTRYCLKLMPNNKFPLTCSFQKGPKI